ncbi:MAG: hemerythrin domain-containing protein [Boseongicola sp.]
MDYPLESRERFPDALRVLLEDYPREAWGSHDNFSALIRFWLERHLMFRRLLEALENETFRALDGNMEARLYVSRLSRYGSLFVGELHGHHTVEDTHYFPQLKPLEAKLERGFDILDRDHHAIDGHLETFTEEANAVLRAVSDKGDWKAATGDFRHGLQRMTRFLDRHLTDEEELVVPVLLKHTPRGMV